MGRPKRLPKILTDHEQDALLEQLDPEDPTEHRNLCMVRLMLDAGLRVGEVVALRPEHVNLETGKLTVREGKGAKDREVYLPRDLCDLIASWLTRRPSSPWLFPTRKGTQVLTRYMREAVKRYARHARVQEWERVSPHKLRHTFATDFLNETGNIRLLQEILGHSNVNTTMIYTHISNRQIRDAMQAFRLRR